MSMNTECVVSMCIASVISCGMGIGTRGAERGVYDVYPVKNHLNMI